MGVGASAKSAQTPQVRRRWQGDAWRNMAEPNQDLGESTMVAGDSWGGTSDQPMKIEQSGCKLDRVATPTTNKYADSANVAEVALQ